LPCLFLFFQLTDLFCGKSCLIQAAFILARLV